MEEDRKPFVYSIIHIGSSNLSMRIVEYHDVDDIRIIEEVKRDTAFGEEVFLTRKLSFSSIRKLCNQLNGLKQLMADYQVEEHAVYATAVLREAENRRSIMDLIKDTTGFDVQVIDMPQEIYYKHFALQHALARVHEKDKPAWKPDLLFVDITSGCVGLTVWDKGTLRYQHNVHIGTLRLLETFKRNQRDSKDYPAAMTEYIHAILEPLWRDIRRFQPDTLIFSGREARIMAELLQLDLGPDNMAYIRPEPFYRLYEETGRMSAPMIMRKYNISEQWASTVAPTLHIYKEILENICTEKVLMMGTTFIEAVTMFYGAKKMEDPSLEEMRGHNLELTRSIADAYYYEPAHAKALESYSHSISSALQAKSAVTDRDEFLLRMAIILYQTGKYVNLLNSNLHAWNLVRGTDIFGISDREKDMVAAIVYYDHKGTPSDDDEPFRILNESAKRTVLKLIAIFRIIRAMDMSRRQKLKDVTARIQNGELLIEYDSRENTALETWMFDQQKEFFENIFGRMARLERR
ncbi:MAG: exopolyphosphatase [Dialister sp.]|nr:exopolyphosphatase [Dialister sp.]